MMNKRESNFLWAMIICAAIFAVVRLIIPTDEGRHGPSAYTNDRMCALHNAVDMYYADWGEYPSPLEWKRQLNYLLPQEVSKDLFADGWGHSIRYFREPDGRVYIRSLGEDGKADAKSGDDIVCEIRPGGDDKGD